MMPGVEPQLWEGACAKCTRHWFAQPQLAHAFASVGIEHGKSSWQMAREYFSWFHANKHPARPVEPVGDKP